MLLSGGMDSIALAYWKRPEVAITIDYAQKAASTELAVAAEVARTLNMRHEIIRVDCSSLGSGDMAGSEPLAAAPVTEWWPFRNQMLLTFAGMRAVAIGVTELMTGSVASDGTHADGRAEFYAAADALMGMQEGNVRVIVPAIGMTTVELIKTSGVPREILAWAHSCHTGPLACGDCRGCHKHFQVTEQLFDDAY
ncbi:7-cyano-7-deazaguanine synthase [Sphingomonas sp. LB-2]|uniref:7-cyano-7-deazaguanine synthase n=1 Tax=Sphingomonas caeni TaxID=2984949 RepID=UPI002230A03B|nr:7-cyano-7-deazaguanine synthase [Sphingomonas caeni]MCW3847387.1 7-cyano-7-deazaguanine synthase [Sphingomonas caeni]